MSQTDAVTDQIRNWYENSPTAQRAYARLRADVDKVVAQAKPTVESVMTQARPKVQELWDQVGPLIDPPAKDAPQNKEAPKNEGGPTATPGSRDA